MNDFERRLSDALKNASESYRPTDPHVAKERFLHRLRRRRLFFYSSGAALAGAAAALAFFVIPDRVAPPTAEPLPPAALVEQQTTIDVGQRPSGVGFGDGSVWVANSTDGTVMVVDPATRRVTKTIEVGGDPDDVAVGVGAAWVYDSGTGSIARIPLPSSGEELEPSDPIQVGEPGSTHMDVAPGAGGLWVAKDDSLFRVDPATLRVQPMPDVVEGPSDIAVGEGSVYVLGATELVRLDPVSLRYERLAEIPQSTNQDIAFREGFVWIANGDAGEVMRLDPETHDLSDPIYVGGNFSGLAVDDRAAWVISGGVSERGVLTRISPDSLAVVEPRAELTGRPYDITLGAGAVWIVNQSDNTLTGLDPEAIPGGGVPGEERELIAVYSAGGDIWGETFNGQQVLLVGGAATLDRQPTLSPDGSSVAFQRTSDTGAGPEIYVRDLSSDEETLMGDGVSPAFGPDGRLAWFQPAPDRDPLDYDIAIARPGEDPITFDATRDWRDPNKYPPPQVGNLTWGLDGTHLYYNQVGRGTPLGTGLLYQIDASGEGEQFALAPNNAGGDEQLNAPSVRAEQAVHVLRLCCMYRDDRAEDVEIGIIRFGEGGPVYETIIELDPSVFRVRTMADPFDDNVGMFDSASLDSAGNLALEGSGNARRWRHTVVRSWFVSTRDGIWLVDANGQVTDVARAIGGLRDIAGIETASAFDD